MSNRISSHRISKRDFILRGNRRLAAALPLVLPLVLLLVLLLVGGLATPVAAQESSRWEMLQQVGIDQAPGAQVPLNLAFRDEQGRSVRLEDLIDGQRPVLLNLVYYRCPMLCNMSLNGLIRALRALSFSAGEEFTVVTVSFDHREGPELAASARRTALRRYGQAGAQDHWHFLTGEAEAIRELADAVGFRFRWDPERGQYAHAAGLMVLTPGGRVSRYLLGVEYAPRDVRLALVEAADGQVGTVTDQVLLLCYQYDPTTGKYGLLIQNVLRAAGILTVACIAGGVGLLTYRERRQRARQASELQGDSSGMDSETNQRA